MASSTSTNQAHQNHPIATRSPSSLPTVGSGLDMLPTIRVMLGEAQKDLSFQNLLYVPSNTKITYAFEPAIIHTITIYVCMYVCM